MVLKDTLKTCVGQKQQQASGREGWSRTLGTGSASPSDSESLMGKALQNPTAFAGSSASTCNLLS